MSVDSVEVTKQERPLCVDLDGTLIKSDTLLDALCQLARHRPLQIWRVPLWLMSGRANLKAEVARRAPLDASFLPYNIALLRFLQSQKRESRPMYLVTGADAGQAERVAAHLGLFQEVLGTDGKTNLTHASEARPFESAIRRFRLCRQCTG